MVRYLKGVEICGPTDVAFENIFLTKRSETKPPIFTVS